MIVSGGIEPQHLAVGTAVEHDHAGVEAALLHRLGGGPVDQLDADHEPDAADVDDRRVAGRGRRSRAEAISPSCAARS